MAEIKKIPPPDDLMDLPGFRETKEGIEARGYGAGWLTKIPDINEKYCMFEPNKKGSNYKSNCPCYEGQYMLGGFSAVKCSGCTDLLPGMMWVLTCDKDYTQCPFYVEQDGE